ncbi:MAG: DUF1552 domain-containing protein [Planctomycetota bacterium]
MRKDLARRTFLKASGVALALPMLESMSPAASLVSDVPPNRMVFVCTTLGLHSPNLWPENSGEEYESTPYLDILREHRNEFTLFSGLQHADQTGRQPHDSEMTWLTAARKPGMGGFRNTVSVDQVAAARLGDVTRFPSITLGTLKAQSQSYTEGGVMIPATTSPASLFAQLFLEGKQDEIRAQQMRLEDGRSILDQLGDQSRSVRRAASTADNHLLDDYFTSVREAEKNIARARGWMDRPKPETDAAQPTDIRDITDLIGRTKLLMDLVPLIIQSDSSRVVSVMIQDHFAVPKVEGVTGNHHNLSHHGQDDSKIDQLEKIESEIVKCFGGLLGSLKEKSESGSPLLDNTTVLFGSNLGNANSHDARNLPIFLAGGGYRHGRYVAFDPADETPLSNLFVAMLNRSGVEAEQFGQSSGRLDW